MPIRITGLNSGLDTEAIISALVSSYNYKTEKYKKAQTKLSWKQDAWKTLNTKIYSFYTGLDSLRFSKNYSLKSTTCSDSTKATVTATSNAVNGTQKLNILQVAQAGYLTGGKLADNVTTGSTLAELGYTGGNGSINLTMGDGTTKEIEVSQGTTINSFINSLKTAGVNASYDDVNKRIFLSSKETGVDNDFTLTGGNVDGASALTKLGLNVQSDATTATYESYTKYYNADGTQLSQNVLDAINAYTQAKDNYDTANAQNSNLSAAYGYASAYSAMMDALKDSGLSEAKQKQLQDLLSMSATARTKSVIGDDGTIYTAKEADQNGNTILAYKDADGNERYIQQVITHTDSAGNSYTESGKVYKDADGNEYTSTGKKDADGNVIYAYTDEDGNTTEVGIKAEAHYYEATASEEGTGFYKYTDADGKTYTQNDDNTFTGSDKKTYKLSDDGTSMYEVDADGNAIDGGLTATMASSEEITKKVYQQNAERTDIKRSSDALTDLKKEVQNEKGYTDKELSSYIDTLTKNTSTVKTYENTQDKVLDSTDPYTRNNIAEAVKAAYENNGGAQGVTDLVNTYAATISANNTIMEDGKAVMDEHQALASIAAMEDGDEKNAAIDDFVKKVQASHDITTNPAVEYNSDAKKIDGQDATITLNGIEYTGSTNAFSINGLSINALAETGAGDENAITITTQTDTQGIYDKIKDFLTQYNALINEITSLYNADTAKGYEPLSDEERDAMSETEIEKWEAKIKDSLLRRDDSLESVMNAMTSSMSKGIEIDGKKYYLSSFGIKTLGYLTAPENQQNAYHIDGDEDDASVMGKSDKLMTAIVNDPDTIISFMQQLTEGLYTEVGKKMQTTTLSSIYTVYNDKEMASEYSDYTDIIKKWEKKLEAQEDYYYNKFTIMETALSKLNSQTSSLSSLFGG